MNHGFREAERCVRELAHVRQTSVGSTSLGLTQRPVAAILRATLAGWALAKEILA